MTELPATIDLNPSGAHPESSIIWLHGLGADANDFVPIVEHFNILEKYKVRFVFPQAPVRSITINNGMKMRGWYDIFKLELAEEEDQLGIQESERLLGMLIEREIELGTPSNRIILAGFSQGGAMSLYTGLRYPKPLGGIIALSSYLPLANHFEKDRKAENQNTPIFMAHGLFDPVVPLMLGQMSKAQLEKLGYFIEWHSYSMPHTVIPQEILDIGTFLEKLM